MLATLGLGRKAPSSRIQAQTEPGGRVSNAVPRLPALSSSGDTGRGDNDDDDDSKGFSGLGLDDFIQQRGSYDEEEEDIDTLKVSVKGGGLLSRASPESGQGSAAAAFPHVDPKTARGNEGINTAHPPSKHEKNKNIDKNTSNPFSAGAAAAAKSNFGLELPTNSGSAVATDAVNRQRIVNTADPPSLSRLQISQTQDADRRSPSSPPSTPPSLSLNASLHSPFD